MAEMLETMTETAPGTLAPVKPFGDYSLAELIDPAMPMRAMAENRLDEYIKALSTVKARNDKNAAVEAENRKRQEIAEAFDEKRHSLEDMLNERLLNHLRSHRLTLAELPDVSLVFDRANLTRPVSVVVNVGKPVVARIRKVSDTPQSRIKKGDAVTITGIVKIRTGMRFAPPEVQIGSSYPSLAHFATILGVDPSVVVIRKAFGIVLARS